MTYVRVTRDQRGYETTSLLHAGPGERPKLLYCFRTAPSVRVGRTAFDEEAIRAIEDQHPDIEFDWPQLLDEASMVVTEPERRPERRRKPPREKDEPPPSAVEQAPPAPVPTRPAAAPNELLDQLVGREIAVRLRRRYAEVVGRIGSSGAADNVRRGWQDRADVLDPDRWTTPEAVLNGVQSADRLFDELRREIDATPDALRA